jgi:hypothetical protein
MCVYIYICVCIKCRQLLVVKLNHGPEKDYQAGSFE